MTTPPTVRFGTFELDYTSGELWNNGKRVVLQDQPAQILCQLVSNPGQVVTREDLRRAVWAEDTFVEFDAALNVAINKVRQALHDSATTPRFIETVPRRGYRFLADVHRVQTAAPLTESMAPLGAGLGTPPARASMRSRWPLWAAAFGIVVAVAAMWRSDRMARPSASPRSVAVLPFQPLVADARDEALEMGMAEAVIIKLGQLKQLRVPSINAVRRYATLDADPLVAGRQLGVEAVLDGSLQRLHSNVRVSARLLDVEKGTTLWAQQWDFPWTDVFTVQDGMAAEVARALALSLAAEERASLRKRPTNVAAYERYLRARYLLMRRTIADSRRAAELLEEAVGLDPASAPAHASLAFAYISVPLLEGPLTPFVSLGRQAARRALELDPTIAEAHAVLGRVAFQFDWDAAAGERELRRGLELEPGNPFVLHCYSLFLAQEGRIEEALAVNERLLAQDPTSAIANWDKAVILYASRRYEDCVEHCLKTLELDRHNVGIYGWLGQSYEQLGRPEEAVAAFITPLTFSEENREIVAALRAAAQREGLTGYWKRWLEFTLKKPEVGKGSVARAYLKVGDHDQALAWLEKLYEERGAWMRNLKMPEWDSLRADPRFQDLLRRTNGTPAAFPAPSRQPTYGSP
jgi:TolB-like protein/DNA-binding winged helix-turn-helix (wHTH) protein/tetratricopeptide (TPR) repeat protein